MPKPPLLGQLLAEAQEHKARSTGARGPHGLAWFVDIRFPAHAEWFRDRTTLGLLADRIAALSWFGDFQVIGREHAVGDSFTRRDALAAALATGDRVTITLAHGEAQATQSTELSENALALALLPGRLELKTWTKQGALSRHRAALLDELLALCFWAHETWSPSAKVANAQAFPFPEGSIDYPRVRPPRIASRRVDAVVDVVDLHTPDEHGGTWARDGRAIAQATPPEATERIERGGLVGLRWVRDPSDAAEMAAACSRHERWVVPLIETSVAIGWNAAGDLQVPRFDEQPSPPLTSFDRSRRAGYLAVDVDRDGTVDQRAWDAARQVALEGALPKGPRVAEVSIVAQDRDAALRIADAARRDGFTRVLYRDPSGTFWDPFPPGSWL